MRYGRVKFPPFTHFFFSIFFSLPPFVTSRTIIRLRSKNIVFSSHILLRRTSSRFYAFFFLFYFLFRDYYRLSGRVMWISHVVTPQGASKQRYHIAPFLALLYTVCMYKSDAKILMVVIKLSVSNINTVALISFVLYLLVSLESNFNQKYNRSYVCRNRSPRKIITLAVDFHSI